MHLFENKVALVTGSSRGIGSAIALKFALSGADVILNYRKAGGSSQAQGEKLCRELQEMGRRSSLIQADIAIKNSVNNMFDEIKKKYGQLDFLILNAAKTPFKPIEKLLERELKQLVEINYLGNIFCIQAALPLLEETQGKIVFISSLGSRFYSPSYPLGSMKAAMESVVRDCAESLRDKNISVNGVCGGIVRTDTLKILRQYWEDIDKLPDKLIVEPDEIAETVLFLCSPAASGILGQIVVVDRGLGNALFRIR